MRGLSLVRAPASIAAALALMAALVLAWLAPAPDAGAAVIPDPTFGSGGFSILDDPADFNERLEDLAIQPDGKILAAGARNGAGGFLLARFNPDGSPDLGFGVGGIRVLPFTGKESPRAIHDIEQRANGKILAVGLGQSLTEKNSIWFAQYTPEGELDTGWGKGGLRSVSFATYGTAFGLALAPNGKSVAVGETQDYVPVVRLTEDGKNDESFNAAPIGVREVDVPGVTGENANAVRVLPDGTVLLGGSTGGKGAFLAELDVNGEKVVGFGNEGIETLDLGSAPSLSGTIEDIAVLPDGRILATGVAGAGSGDNQLVVARFKANGELDPSFAAGGIFRSNPTPGRDAGEALAVQPDGRIVVAGLRGQEAMDTRGDTFLIRLTADGQPDPTFGPGGEFFASASTSVDQAEGLALQPDGKPVIAGFANVQEAHQLLTGRFTFTEEAFPKVNVTQDLRPNARCAGRRATIVGTAKADRLKGTKGADVIAGLAGDDRINSGGGNDLICAGGGRDVINAGKGRDRVLGGGGADRIVGGPGPDLCSGGPGRDTASASCERLKRVP